MKKKIVALIPLRKGSKSIPLKNIKPIAGKPLCYWVITAAKQCDQIDEVWVSTDGEKIAEISRKYGAKIIKRPPEFATDTASTESVMLHFQEKVDFEVLVTIQATSPLLSSQDLSKALKTFDENNLDSLLSAVEFKRFVWSHNFKPFNYDPFNRPRRQDFEGSFLENGAFYITKYEILKNYKNRLGGNIGIYKMSNDTATEIDEPEDWTIVEKLLINKHPLSKLHQIKHIISNFDGVFTDNTILTSQDGKETIVTSKTDSLGLDILLPQLNIGFSVVSREKNPVVKKRLEKLKIPVIDQATNKVAVIENFLKKHNYNWENICYIGNDLNDLGAIKKSGYSFAPLDAHRKVKTSTNYITSTKGGHGVIREILEIFQKNNEQT